MPPNGGDICSLILDNVLYDDYCNDLQAHCTSDDIADDRAENDILSRELSNDTYVFGV